MEETFEAGCPISRVLCEKWGFWLELTLSPANVHPSQT